MPTHVTPADGSLAAGLAADLAIVTALTAVAAAHPDLPDLISRSYGDTGLSATPYLPMRPVGALAAWLAALPDTALVTADPGPGDDGSEITVEAVLDGFDVTLSVVTYRPVTRDAQGRVTPETVAALAAAELDHQGRDA